MLHLQQLRVVVPRKYWSRSCVIWLAYLVAIQGYNVNQRSSQSKYKGINAKIFVNQPTNAREFGTTWLHLEILFAGWWKIYYHFGAHAGGIVVMKWAKVALKLGIS